MKSVLISIRPKWCELIANGEKTTEVRKTRPKFDVPFKCYIYCTKSTGSDSLWVLNEIGRSKFADKTSKIADVFGVKDVGDCYKGNEKVIGEFVCDFVELITFQKTVEEEMEFEDDISECLTKDACLNIKEAFEYSHGKPLYGWHISDLMIYDEPKELGEFRIKDKVAIKMCEHRFRAGQPEDVARNGGWIQGGFMCMKSGEPEWCENCLSKPLTRPPQSWCYAEEQTTERNEKA